MVFSIYVGGAGCPIYLFACVEGGDVGYAGASPFFC